MISLFEKGSRSDRIGKSDTPFIGPYNILFPHPLSRGSLCPLYLFYTRALPRLFFSYRRCCYFPTEIKAHLSLHEPYRRRSIFGLLSARALFAERDESSRLDPACRGKILDRRRRDASKQNQMLFDAIRSCVSESRFIGRVLMYYQSVRRGS